ncbi:TetR/AcrR family transcriptional regulator [Ensifer soli]|uniref:TetR/AcrR family transcriptional regulator n=1 Tax=Ciceribacter sp. sgz301302 TaxID=3342379 RepID=UPI0035BB3DED
MARNSAAATEATRAALMEQARARFIEKGYAETATPDIAAAAGVTRGALYHHFADKKALFRAVLEREATGVAAEIDAAAIDAVAPTAALLAGTAAYFDAMAAEGRARLLLLEGPAVLGLDGMRAIDRGAAERTLRDGLAAALPGAGEAEIDPLADLLSAAFDRAALSIAAGGRRDAYEAAIARILAALVSR